MFTEYMLISKPDPGSVAKEVSARLKEGWHLHAGPAVTGEHQGSAIYSQALVR